MGKNRTANSETIDTILLASLILILGFFAWFMIGNINRNQPLEPILINDTEPQSEESETENNPKLMETITDLTLEGCSIIILETKVYLDNPYYVDYEEFKPKALESKFVIVSQGYSNTFLLVQIKNIQWIWIPS